jgi:hypothetical protein
MTHTEKYNQYVQEWIKENPAFSGSYESMLDFDEWVEKYMIEFAEWSVARAMGFVTFKLNDNELEIFKKEKGL